MSRHTMLAGLGLAALAGLPLLVGCADLDRGGGYRGRDRERTVQFRCDDDRRFEVTFRDRGDEATVRTREDSYRLQLKDRNGRERQYGDGDARLTVDGDEARLRLKDQKDYTNCEAR